MSGLGEHVGRLREAYGFDLGHLPELSGPSVSRLTDIEAGSSLSTAELAQLAGALAVDTARLHAGKIEEMQWSGRYSNQRSRLRLTLGNDPERFEYRTE